MTRHVRRAGKKYSKGFGRSVFEKLGRKSRDKDDGGIFSRLSIDRVSKFRGSKSGPVNDLVEVLLDESGEFKNNASILNYVLFLQTDAREKNYALLYRETSGIKFRKPGRRGKHLRVLDFPLSNDGRRRITDRQQNPLKSIAALGEGVQDKTLAFGPMEFRYSIFSSCLVDLDKCLFYQHKKAKRGSSSYIYTISMPKKEILTSGQHIFHLMPINSKEDIFRAGEQPIIKSMSLKNPRRKVRFSKRKIKRYRRAHYGPRSVHLREYSPERKYRVRTVRDRSVRNGLSFLLHVTDIMKNNTWVIGSSKGSLSNVNRRFKEGITEVQDELQDEIRDGISKLTKEKEDVDDRKKSRNNKLFREIKGRIFKNR
jgi:hypothetical protein